MNGKQIYREAKAFWFALQEDERNEFKSTTKTIFYGAVVICFLFLMAVLSFIAMTFSMAFKTIF